MSEPVSPSSTPDLDGLLIGEDLVPIRPAKVAGQTSLDFSGLLNPPLLLHEDLKEGCGGQLWPAGMVLARYLLKNVDLIRGKVMIELGAGGGLVGLALAKGLKSVGGLPKPKPILITDLPILLPLQEQNIRLNELPPSLIMSAELSWGSPFPDSIPDLYRKPDIVLAADCVYFEPAFPLLLETLKALLNPEQDDQSNNSHAPVCFFCMKKRRKADMRFITTMKKTFKVEVIDASQEIAEEGGGIFLYKVSRRDRTNQS